MSVATAIINLSKGKLMETPTYLRTEEVIENLRNAKDFGLGEAYAYAFGYAWAMLSEVDQLKMIARTAEMLKEKN
jgi:hypothetical protein